MADLKLTHVDGGGRAAMVHVGDKAVTPRRAVAEGLVRCCPELLDRVRRDDLAKGSVLSAARLAGIQAAKRTDELIPLCHTIPLESVEVDLEVRDDGIAIRATAAATWKTGVEMEALTAVMGAALTIIDMGKAIDKAMVIESVQVIEKTGGRSGDYHAVASGSRDVDHRGGAVR